MFNFQTNFIYFDYKGDVVDNEKFLKTAKIQFFQLLQGGVSLPANLFVLSAYDEQSINVSAREKAESFASINAKLGVVQKGALTEAIRAAYAMRQDTDKLYPDFQDVLEIARLEPWQVVARSSVKTEEFTKFTAEAFYQNY